MRPWAYGGAAVGCWADGDAAVGCLGCLADGDAAVGCLGCLADGGAAVGCWADGDDVRTAFAVRGGARRQLCEVRQHRGRRLCGVCVARAACVFHVKHDVYRVAGWLAGDVVVDI